MNIPLCAVAAEELSFWECFFLERQRTQCLHTRIYQTGQIVSWQQIWAQNTRMLCSLSMSLSDHLHSPEGPTDSSVVLYSPCPKDNPAAGLRSRSLLNHWHPPPPFQLNRALGLLVFWSLNSMMLPALSHQLQTSNVMGCLLNPLDFIYCIHPIKSP